MLFSLLSFAQEFSKEEREHLCTQQRGVCDNACMNQFGGTDTAECNQDTLAFTCICKGGGILNDTKVDNVVVFEKCQKNFSSCKTNCKDDVCAKNCEVLFKCGTAVGEALPSSTNEKKKTTSTLKGNAEMLFGITSVSIMTILFQ